MRISGQIYRELIDEMIKDLEWSFRIDIRSGRVDELRAILANALAEVRKQRDFSQALLCSTKLEFVERAARWGKILGRTRDLESSASNSSKPRHLAPLAGLVG